MLFAIAYVPWPTSKYGSSMGGISVTSGRRARMVWVKTFAPLVAPLLASRLSADKEWLASGQLWVLRALLPEINDGHRNITEAIVMLAGEPMPAAQIVPELDLDKSVPAETRALALDISLADDDRFRNVGAHESPLWTLKATV